MMDGQGNDNKRKRQSTENEEKEDNEDNVRAVRRRVQERLQAESLLPVHVMGQRTASGQMAAPIPPDVSRGYLTGLATLQGRLPPRGSRGTASISDAALANALLHNTSTAALQARLQLLRSTSLAGNITSSSSLLGSTQTFLPRNYDHRDLAAARATPSLLHGLGLPPVSTHSLEQIAARRRIEAAVARQQHTTEDPVRLAPAASIIPGSQLTGLYPPFQQQQQQPASSGLASSSTTPKASGPKTLYLQCDIDSLTPYQCLARQQIQLFEASPSDADAGTQGRNRTITVGQVGIRCRHCAHLPLRERAKGSTYYPSKLTGIYQAAQNMTNSHMVLHCQKVPKEIRDELKSLGNKKSSAGGGKGYWSGGATILGVIEDEHGLRFGNSSQP